MQVTLESFLFPPRVVELSKYVEQSIQHDNIEEDVLRLQEIIGRLIDFMAERQLLGDIDLDRILQDQSYTATFYD